MPKPSEAQLRDAKADVLDRMATCQRENGVMPTPESNEAYLTPILESLSRDELHTEVPPEDKRTDHQSGDTALGRKRGVNLKPGWATFRSDDIDAHAPPTLPRWRSKQDYIRWMGFRAMQAIPEWNERVLKATTRTPNRPHNCGFNGVDLVRCPGCQDTENLLEQIYQDFVRFVQPEREHVRKLHFT